MHQKGISLPLLLIPIGLILFLLFFLFSDVLFNQLNQNPSDSQAINNQTPTVSTPPQPTNRQPLNPNTNYIIYTLDDSGFRELLRVNDLSGQQYGQIYPTFDDATGQLYIADRKKITQYDLTTKKQSTIYTQTDDQQLISGFSVQKDNLLYVTQFTKTQDQFNTESTFIEEINLSSGSKRQTLPQIPVMYGGLSYLFKTTKGDDVIGSFGGDGCGGFGEVRLLTSDKTSLITKTGGGCVEDPRYIGYLKDENKIILVAVIKDSWSEMDGARYDKILKKDVYSGEEQTIIDLTSLSEQLISYTFDAKTNRIQLQLARELLYLNGSTGEIIEKVSLHKNLNFEDEYYSLFYGDSFYRIEEEPITDNFNMKLKIVNNKSGDKKEINWGKLYPISGIASILGFWDDKPIISVYIYPKVNY